MAGTKAGAEQLKKSMIEKYGSEENWKAHMRAIASEGGKLGKTGGFGSKKIGPDGLTGAQRARIAGVEGGRKSRRGPTKQDYQAAAKYEKKAMSFETPVKKVGFLSRFKVSA